MADLYPFSASFEKAVVAMLCGSTGFYNAFVAGLEDNAFPSNEARVLASMCRFLHTEAGRGPGSATIVEQRIRRHHNDGKITMDVMLATIDYLTDCIDAVLPDEEMVRHELASIVSRRSTARAMEAGFMTFAQKGDMKEVAAAIVSAQNVGKIDVSVGDTLDSLVDDLVESSLARRLSTGCIELDRALGGEGFRNGEMSFALAPTKTGKSLYLIQEAVLSVRASNNTLAVTLELSSAMWRARYLAGLTGTPTSDIIANPRTTQAIPRYHRIKHASALLGRPLGHFACKRLPGGATSLADVLDLVKREEDKLGQQIHTLIIDYCDKMIGRDPSQHAYLQMLDVYEGFRLDAEASKRWAITASQAKGHVQEGDMPKLGDCADSQNKVRVTDAMLGLQKHITDDLRGKVSMQLLAVRNGEETQAIGPFDSGAEYGVFLKSVAFPEYDVEKALVDMEDDFDPDLSVFR